MASSVMIVLALCASAAAFRVPGGAAKAPLSASCATAFRVPGAAARPATALRSATITDEARALRADGLYAADRHVTTSRFLVPRDEQVAFEQSWVARADALKDAPGLTYFQMSKYAADFMGPPLGDDEPNYHAYAVWESAEAAAAFDAGGGRPATYDGLFSLALPAEATGVPPPARAVDAAKRLPREAFVASNRFGIKPGFEKQFEDMWAGRDSSLADLEGFVNFTLLRREGDVDDGNTYVSYTTWKNVQAFNNWRGSDNFKRSHSGPKPAESPYAKMPKVVTYKTFLTCGADEGM